MKRARNLRTRSKHRNFIPERQEHGEPTGDQPISKEVVKKKPVVIGDNGFTSFIKKFKHTEEGVESEVQKPVLINGLGYRVDEKDIKGRCDICKKLVSKIFTCFFHGCKRLVCEKHVYFFKVGDNEVPLCPKHYKEAINEFDTWQSHQIRQIRKEKNEG